MILIGFVNTGQADHQPMFEALSIAIYMQ